MRFSGSVGIRAPRDRVWAFVTDPDQVAGCVPGVESVEVVDATHVRARAKVGTGFFSTRLVVDVELTDLMAPGSAAIRAHGQATGSTVEATARMRLHEDGPGSTRLDWEADAAIGGALAGLGGRMMEGTADRIVGEAFECMRRKLETAA